MTPRWRVVVVWPDGTEKPSFPQSEAKARRMYEPEPGVGFDPVCRVKLQRRATDVRGRKVWETVEEKPSSTHA
jgi:hypothetical protein